MAILLYVTCNRRQFVLPAVRETGTLKREPNARAQRRPEAPSAAARALAQYRDQDIAVAVHAQRPALSVPRADGQLQMALLSFSGILGYGTAGAFGLEGSSTAAMPVLGIRSKGAMSLEARHARVRGGAPFLVSPGSLAPI